MVDNDGDSHMDSPPDLSDPEGVETPAGQIINSAILSPPDSQHRTHTSEMPTAAPGLAGANSNGKRPLNTISNGAEENNVIDLTGMADTASPASGKPQEKADFPPKTHQGSGYTWDKNENEPGYAWLNKKALDERQRAWEGMVHKDLMVKNRYGDPFEMVEREQAVLNSLKQR